MAYSFDGANDNIVFSSAANIDNIAQFTATLWAIVDTDATQFLIGKGGNGANGWGLYYKAGGNLTFYYGWSGGIAQWETTNGSFTTGVPHSVILTYDKQSTANDPAIYLDGVSQTISEIVAPSGTANLDGALSLRIGEPTAGTLDFDGTISHVSYDNGIISASDRNRTRWWGYFTRMSGAKCFYPLYNDAINRGSEPASDGTVTGAVLASLPRVERCWGNMMGCGR